MSVYQPPIDTTKLPPSSPSRQGGPIWPIWIDCVLGVLLMVTGCMVLLFRWHDQGLWALRGIVEIGFGYYLVRRKNSS